jgi:AraC family transcriptional regulator
MRTRAPLHQRSLNEVLLDSHGTGWAGLPLVRTRTPAIPYMRIGHNEVATLALTSGGESEVRWRTSRGESREMWDESRLTFMGSGLDLQHVRTTGAIESLGLVFDPLLLESWTGSGRSDGALLSRSLSAHIVDRDAHLLSLMRAMATEIQRGCPSGPMYAQSMSIAVATYFWGRFSSHCPAMGKSAITPSGIEKLKAYMRENIGDEVTLQTLATQVGMTPRHFAESFRQSCGKSPYQYFMQLRIEEAKSRLIRGRTPMTQIAMDLGFASASHFSTTFRKAVGLSPRVFRSRSNGGGMASSGAE